MAKDKPKAAKRRNPSNKPHSENPFKRKKKSNSSRNPNLIPLGKNPLFPEKPAEKKEKRKKKEKERGGSGKSGNDGGSVVVSTAPAAEQLRFFIGRYESANGMKLSPLELEGFKDTCMVELPQGVDQDVNNFSQHMKATSGASWKKVLCEEKLSEGINGGAPAILVISVSALRSLELLRGLKPLTRECRPVKLFAKHMKVEEQVALLKGRVNIACGTPSRIKKLIDIDALSLSRLAVIVLDMHRDAKGYSLFTLPQVSDEFWDLYKSHFNERLLQGETRICFYGSIPDSEFRSIKSNKHEDHPDSDI
ncbi:protein CMSS1 [Iris pallida]|uniref:Protein CMSS1 n=1 Tax=Iris pallida TaxID=29817 RepID=A0AAX6FYZ0_IRIPA|nr:protein CMSS1 [Iris pallida]KAJ6834622.1 protein CMSS1 [Iris pallida]